MGESPALEMAGLTDVGRVRGHNEDAIRWDASAGWAILADGMGGHLAGDVASELAIDTIAARLAGLAQVEASGLENALRTAVIDANDVIHQHAKGDLQCYNMGTTVVAVVVRQAWLYCAHVGDSRLYRFNQDGLIQITRDHSLVQELVDEGMLSVEEAANSVHRNVITRALGLKPEVDVDVLKQQVEADDIFLLCSDGLSDSLNEEEMAQLLSDCEWPSMTQALVDAANERGGQDNISLILLRMGK